MLTQEERKAAIKQRHQEQCAIMIEIMEIESMLSGQIHVEAIDEYQGEEYTRKISYPELIESFKRVAREFLNERLITLWTALEDSQNRQYEFPSTLNIRQEP